LEDSYGFLEILLATDVGFSEILGIFLGILRDSQGFFLQLIEDSWKILEDSWKILKDSYRFLAILFGSVENFRRFLEDSWRFFASLKDSLITPLETYFPEDSFRMNRTRVNLHSPGILEGFFKDSSKILQKAP